MGNLIYAIGSTINNLTELTEEEKADELLPAAFFYDEKFKRLTAVPKQSIKIATTSFDEVGASAARAVACHRSVCSVRQRILIARSSAATRAPSSTLLLPLNCPHLSCTPSHVPHNPQHALPSPAPPTHTHTRFTRKCMVNGLPPSLTVRSSFSHCQAST